MKAIGLVLMSLVIFSCTENNPSYCGDSEDVVRLDAGTTSDSSDAGSSEVQADVSSDNECRSDDDCNAMGACFIGTCRWRECYYRDICGDAGTSDVQEDSSDAGLNDISEDTADAGTLDTGSDTSEDLADSGTSDSGSNDVTADSADAGTSDIGFNDTSDTDSDISEDLCEVAADCPPAESCYQATCDFIPEIGALGCNYGYLGEAHLCELDGLSGRCYDFECVVPSPECDVDTPCEFGDCDLESEVCVEWECYMVDHGDGTADVKLCPVGQGCIEHVCSEDIVVVACTNDDDCADGFCVANPESGEDECISCVPDSADGMEYDTGCSVGQPLCVWDDGYSCAPPAECLTDENCGRWSQCESGVCTPYGPIFCEFTCPVDDEIDWQTVVIWHGEEETTERECGGSWTVTQSNLCEWGTTHPVAKFNLWDDVWEWGGGTDTIVNCNYLVTLSPDSTLSGGPSGETLGDLGVTIMEFEEINCYE